jgi:serine O-acetyltransferase
MEKKLINSLFSKKYKDKCPHLCRNKIEHFLTDLLAIIFPQMGQNSFDDEQELEIALMKTENDLKYILSCLHKEFDPNFEASQKLVDTFYASLDTIEQQLSSDAQFIADEDPAANSIEEVLICYPGFYAIAVYRIAHFFYQHEIPLLPRVLTEIAHQKTGIDIHPGATIASPFFIDHGTGIVIGETTTIGERVKIFQGVTLGALSVRRKMKDTKRHPTIGQGSIIYSNTTILGGETTIGENTTVGGNVWLTESIPANSQVYRKHGWEVDPK